MTHSFNLHAVGNKTMLVTWCETGHVLFVGVCWSILLSLKGSWKQCVKTAVWNVCPWIVLESYKHESLVFCVWIQDDGPKLETWCPVGGHTISCHVVTKWSKKVSIKCNTPKSVTNLTSMLVQILKYFGKSFFLLIPWDKYIWTL